MAATETCSVFIREGLCEELVSKSPEECSGVREEQLEIIVGLEPLSEEWKLKELGLFSLERRWLRRNMTEASKA